MVPRRILDRGGELLLFSATALKIEFLPIPRIHGRGGVDAPEYDIHDGSDSRWS